MRRITSVAMMFVLLFQMGGTWGMFQMRRSQIRHSVKREIKLDIVRNRGIIFIFSPSEWKTLEWEREDEFRWEGHMYDVMASQVCDDGSHELTCFADTEETQLHERLAAACRKAMDDDPVNGSERTQPWSWVYLLTSGGPWLPQPPFTQPVPLAQAQPEGLTLSQEVPPPRA